MRELIHLLLPIAVVLYAGVAGVRGIRQMSGPGLTLAERKLIGNRMLIRITLLEVMGVIVFVLTGPSG